MRVVGSLTTIPSRISQIEKTLLTLTNQSYKLDAVYLSVPYSCQREDTTYLIPDVLTEYCNIIRCQDYGPITKVMGALLSEQDPDTVIITFDDDKLYPEGMVEKLVSKHRAKPDCAIGSAGFKVGTFPFYMSIAYNEHEYNGKWYTFDINSSGESVDILLGSPGVLYIRKFFPVIDDIGKLLRYPIKDNVLYRNDDVVISGLLSQQSIQRLIYKMPHVDDSGNNSNALSKNKSDYVFSLIKAIYRARKEDMFKEQVVYTRSKTTTYPLIMGLAAIVLFSILFSTRRNREYPVN
jgi:hypothetical protein